MSDKSKKQTRLIKNTLWFTFGTFSSKIITFLLVPLYTSILSTAEYSTTDIISTTVSLALPFFSLVITSAVFRFVIDKKEHYDQIFSLGLVVILLGAMPLALLSYVVFQYVETIQSFWLYFITIYLLSAISTLFSEFLLGMEQVKIVSIVGIIHTFCFVTSNILFLVVLKMNIKGYFLAYIVSNAITSILYFCFGKLYRYIVNPFHGTKDLFGKMIHYSIPLIPNSAMWWITNSSDRFFVLSMVSASANGLLSISYKIPSMLSILISIFKNAWDISVCEDFENENGKAFFQLIYQKYIELTLLISSMIIVSAKILGRILYSSEFFNAWKLSIVLIIGFAFHSISGFLGSAFTAAKQTKMLFYSTLVGAVANLIGNYFLIRWLGVLGAVISTIISYFLVMIMRRIAVSQYVKLQGKLIKNTVGFILLMIQAVLMYIDTPFAFMWAVIIFAGECFLNWEFINGSFNLVINKLKFLRINRK